MAADLTQAELAGRVGLQRSMITKIEAGERGVDALELWKLADVLGVPLAHLITSPSSAIVSRRAALLDESDEAGRLRYLLDVDLEEHSRRVTWLVDGGWLRPPESPFRAPAGTAEEARDGARRARQALGAGRAPLGDLAGVAEAFGCYLAVVDRAADGASLSSGPWGAAVIGGRVEPGRRRMTAAHELGHHVLGDEYSSDVGVAASRDEREAAVQAFAVELLLPRDVVLAGLQGAEGDDRFSALLQLAAAYRVSWSVVLAVAEQVGLGQADARRLRARQPVDTDFLRVVGELPRPDLSPATTGPAYRRAVLTALESERITAARAHELLYGAVPLAALER